MLIFGAYELQREYRLFNIYGAPAGSRISLIEYHLGSIKDNLLSQFSSSRDKGLELEEWIIPERSFASLDDNFPYQIKDWQTLYYKYPDGDFKKAKMRFRGDNPNGWARDKKSIRVKLRKSKLINQQRVFNYNLPQDQNILDTYLSYFIGERIDLLTPEFNLIEAKINGVNKGIYFKNSQIDEIFLRRNNIMPVNIYKGEQYHTSKDVEKSNDLFNNPSLWTKLSIFNQRSEDDFKDLEYLLNIIRMAENSEEKFNELMSLADIDEWAKFSAYQTLLQTWHNMHDHNMRIVSDPWKATFIPFVHDTGSLFTDESNQKLIYESINHSLYELYNKSSEFLLKKYIYLYDFVENGILTDASKHVDSIKSKLLNSWSRDPFHTQFSLTNSAIAHDSDSNKLKLIIENLSRNMSNRESILFQTLNETPMSSWFQENKTLSIVISSILPVSEIILFTEESIDRNSQIYFDKDNDGLISEEDIEIPLSIDENKLTIHANFLSNRVAYATSYEAWPEFHSPATKFNLLFSKDLSIVSLSASNGLNGQRYEMQNQELVANSPTRFNIPVFKKELEEIIWTGTKIIKSTLIIENPILIEPGTKIFLDNDANIIFKNKVQINGTIEDPVEVLPLNEDSIWGTFALQGKKTSNSNLRNLIMRGGSGYENEFSKYTGMFSIHDSEGVSIKNLLIENNRIYDDAVHIIYSSVDINGCELRNAFSDAIDIDISNVNVRNCIISNSGNDGFDSMSSEVNIFDSLIIFSGDKGVSVGEGSNLNLISSKIEKNYIGIENKDNSKASIFKSELIDNQTQINSYLKNWQYEDGAEILILDTVILPYTDRLNSEKGTKTLIYDQNLSEIKVSKKKNIYSLKENPEMFNKYINKVEELRNLTFFEDEINGHDE